MDLDFATLVAILAGLAGTYSPRVLPYLLSGLKLPPALDRYLSFVPPAALGALIIPGLLDDFSAAPMVGIVAVVSAGLWARFRGGLVIPVLIAFAVAWAGLSFFAH